MTVRSGLEWLALHRVFAWRNNTGGGWLARKRNDPGLSWIEFGKPGSGDIVGVTPYGRHFEVEDKQGKGRQQENQVVHQQMVERSGGLYVVTRSDADLEAARCRLVGTREAIREYVAFLERYSETLPD